MTSQSQSHDLLAFYAGFNARDYETMLSSLSDHVVSQINEGDE